MIVKRPSFVTMIDCEMKKIVLDGQRTLGGLLHPCRKRIYLHIAIYAPPLFLVLLGKKKALYGESNRNPTALECKILIHCSIDTDCRVVFGCHFCSLKGGGRWQVGCFTDSFILVCSTFHIRQTW